MQLSGKLHRHVALCVRFAANRVVDDAVGVDSARALRDMHVTGEIEIVGLVVERPVLRVDDRIVFGIMHVTDRLINLCRAVDFRAIGRQRRRAVRFRSGAAGKSAIVSASIVHDDVAD